MRTLFPYTTLFRSFAPPTADACVRTKLDLAHPCGLSLIHLTLSALFLESPAKPRYPGYARTSLQSSPARSPTHTTQTPRTHTIEDTLRHALVCLDDDVWTGLPWARNTSRASTLLALFDSESCMLRVVNTALAVHTWIVIEGW